MLKNSLKYVGYGLQALGFVLFYGIFRFVIPFKWGSAFGGFVAEKIGPHISVSRIARGNLKKAFPEKTAPEIEALVAGMWNNLGRTISEYARVADLDLYGPESPLEIVGAEQIEALKKNDGPSLLFLGHMGNWEYATLVALQQGVKIAQVYRTLNNPLIARMIDYVHGRVNAARVTKGQKGARQSLKTLKGGINLSMLVDQKMNEGIPVPFFGRDAMTAPAIARLALKFQCPIVPIRVERLEGVKCRVTYYPPLDIPVTGTVEEKVFHIMSQINQMLESWIRERPDQWFWVHNRWPKN